MAIRSSTQQFRNCSTAAMALALAGLVFAVGPARTASGDEVTGAVPATEAGTEVQRFCSNIADAARDQRLLDQYFSLLTTKYTQPRLSVPVSVE